MYALDAAPADELEHDKHTYHLDGSRGGRRTSADEHQDHQCHLAYRRPYRIRGTGIAGGRGHAHHLEEGIPEGASQAAVAVEIQACRTYQYGERYENFPVAT